MVFLFLRRVFEALGERMHFKGMEAIGLSVPEAAGFFGAQDFRDAGFILDDGRIVGEGILHPCQGFPDVGARGVVRKPVVDPAALFVAFDEAGLPQDRQVLRGCGRGQIQKGCDLAYAELAASQGHEDAYAVFVGKRAAGGQEVEHGVFLFSGREGSGEPGEGRRAPLKRGSFSPPPNPLPSSP